MTSTDDRREDCAREVFRAMGDLVLDNQRRREVTEQTGMSFGRMRALRRIANRPMPMRELAALLIMDPPNLTTLIDDLERSGLVKRQPHPTDRRVKIVVATAEGAALAQRADAILGRPPEGLLELPDDELETLRKILTKVHGNHQAPH